MVRFHNDNRIYFNVACINTNDNFSIAGEETTVKELFDKNLEE